MWRRRRKAYRKRKYGSKEQVKRACGVKGRTKRS